MGKREVVFRVDVLNNLMQVVATTSHIYRFSLGGEGLAAFVDYENKTVDHGEVADPGTYTLSFDYSRMPQWMIDGGYRLYGQMVVTHNGEVVATCKYNGDSYTPTLCGDYEISYNLTLKDNSEVVETINEIHTFTVPVAEAGKVYFHDGGTTKLPMDQKLMGVGETYQILYDVEPIFAKDSLVWTSSNTSVVTVDQNGLVAAVATGTATVTASNADGSISDSMVIQVTTPSCIIVGGVGLQPGQYLEQGSGTVTTTKPADNYAYVYINDLDQMCLVLHNYTYTGTGSFFEMYNQSGIQTTDEDGYGYPICIYLEGENCIDMSPATEANGYNWAYALVTVGETYIYGVDGGSLNLVNAGYAFVGKNGVIEIHDAVINTENVTYGIYDKDGMNLYAYNSTLNIQAKYGMSIQNLIQFEGCDVDVTTTRTGINMSSAVLEAYDSNVRITSIEDDGIYGTGASEVYVYSGNMHVDGNKRGIWLYSGGKLSVAGNLLATSARDADSTGAYTDANACALKMDTGVFEYDASLYAYGSTECDGTNGGVFADASRADYDFVFVGFDPYVFDVNVYTDADCTTPWDGTTDLNSYATVRITHKHTLQHFAEVPAGCETTGVCEYWYCSGCRKLYAEEACTTVITNTTLAALDHDWVWNTCTEPRHCLRCELIDENYPASGHNWSAATCQTPVTCFNCGTTMGGTVDHNWQDATCDLGEYCSYCYIERSDPLGHALTGEVEYLYGAPTCSNGAEGQQYCTRCEGYVGFMADPDPDAHVWIGADCENPAFCEECGVTSSEDPSHSWVAGDCETPTTCSVCGQTKGTVSSHRWKSATCSYPKYCRVCGKTEGEALAHTWTAATCTDPKTCSVCYATEGDPLPHSLSAATCDSGETCTVCGWVETEPLGHSYTDDVCTVCGKRDPGAPIIPTMAAKSFSLSFESEILVNFYYTVSDETSVVQQGMLVFYSDPGTPDYTAANEIYDDAVYVPATGRYMCTTDGIAAKEMGDTRYYVAYAMLSDGSFAYSKAYDYSPKKYAVNMLGKASTSDKQKALCVAMLNYGAAAQTYFSYNTEDLMNSVLTDEQKAMNIDYNKTLFTGAVAADSAKTVNFAKTATGFSKRNATVSFEGAFAINYYFTPNVTVNGDITFYYWTPEDYAAADVLTVENATGSSIMVDSGSGPYWAEVCGIAAKTLDDTYYVAAVYSDADGNSYCTGVIAYSLSKYCMNNDSGDMAGLAQATAMYGYYAKLYFTT